jgi:hypothetical protein
MMSENAPDQPAKEGRKAVLLVRELRLKAALKENMAKRKAQLKARNAEEAEPKTDK